MTDPVLAEYEAIKKEVLSKVAGTDLGPKEKPIIGANTLRGVKSGIIRGDMARNFAPKLGVDADSKTNFEFENIKREALGLSKMAEMTQVQDPDEMQKILANKTPEEREFEKIKAEALGGTPIQLGKEKATSGDSMWKSFKERYGDNFTTNTIQTALTAMSIDEHLMFKAISDGLGRPKKENLGDYNYTTFLKDSGAPDDWTTDVVGTALSIFAVPSTYLTGGVSAESKLLGLGKKMSDVFLTKEGRKLVNTLAKGITENQVTKLTAQGVAFNRNKIAVENLKEVESQILKRFTQIKDLAKESVTVSTEVAGLPERIIHQGQYRLRVPFSGREFSAFQLNPFNGADISLMGQTVVKGEKVAELANKAHLPQLVEGFRKTSLGAAAEDTIDFLGEKLIKNFKVDKGLVQAIRYHGQDADQFLEKIAKRQFTQGQIESAKVTAHVMEAEERFQVIKQAAIERSSKFFEGMSRDQQKLFSENAINASLKEEKVVVTSTDKMVQDKLDQWFGQGPYKGKGIADELAEKSKLFELDDRKLMNWFPGINPDINPAKMRFMVGKRDAKDIGPATRKFLSERKGDPDFYSRNPIQAMATRLIQINHANLQDELYRGIVGSRLGNPTKFIDELEGIEKGFAKLERPLTAKVWSGKEGELAEAIEKGTEAVTMYDRNFVRQYESLIYENKPNKFIELVNAYSNSWRRSVTSNFPSFHARNFTSNVILNAMRIGGHAINPETNLLAYKALMGKDMEKAFVNDIGERLTLKGIMEEADKVGAVNSGHFQHDIGGENLSELSKFQWVNFLNKYVNPFSSQRFWTVKGTQFGEAIENQARLVNYITWRKKGLTPQAAAKEVEAALFDYGAVTDFEKKYAKLFLGFYTFSRKALENHIKLAIHDPGVIKAQFLILANLAPNEKQWREQLPDWAKKSVALNLRGAVLSGFGLPLEDTLQVLTMDQRDAILRANPVFRVPVERVVGKDFFSGRDLEKVNNANEFGFIVRATEGKYRDVLPDFIKDHLWGLRKFFALQRDPGNKKKIIGDPTKLHYLRGFLTSRFQSTIGQLEKTDVPMYEHALRFTLGLSFLNPDARLKQSIEKWKTVEEIKKIAEENNLAKPLDTYFYSTDKFASSVANWYMKQIKYGGSVERMRKLKAKFEKEAVKIRTQETSNPYDL